MRNRFNSLRARLILFVLLAALPALALTWYSGLEQRQQAAAAAEENVLRLVSFTAVNHELLIENTRGFITALSHAMGSSNAALDECDFVFSHILQEHFPYYSAFYVADLDGHILCTMSEGDVPTDLLGCQHYLTLRDADDFVVSEYHICRNTGKGVISMGYPVQNPQGERVAVINIGIHLEWFNQMAAEAQLPPGSTLTVLDRNGVILAHYPDPETWVGEEMPEDSIAEVILEQKSGTVEGVGFDGVPRLYAFNPLSGTEESVFLSIGIPTELAYAEANQTLIRNLSLMLFVILLALAAAWFLAEVFILRQTKSLVRTTEQLAQGDLEARTDIPYSYGELGQLAQAFDQMAASLATREAERDLAEQAMQEYAAELEISNRELQDFANIASHDLQEPLRKIQTFGELLETRHVDQLDERGMYYIGRMRSASGRMQNLLLGLLAYSRVTTRAQPFEPVPLQEVVVRVIGDMDLLIEETQAQVQIDSLPVIEADVIQMYQLFQNLIGNAIKFHPDDAAPQVRIESRCYDETLPKNGGSISMCEIQVVDNGIGFDMKYLERVFQPFQRLHGSDEYPGTGMGLAICRKIVERHNGRLTARSQPGQGATMIVTLPVKQNQGDGANDV